MNFVDEHGCHQPTPIGYGVSAEGAVESLPWNRRPEHSDLIDVLALDVQLQLYKWK